MLETSNPQLMKSDVEKSFNTSGKMTSVEKVLDFPIEESTPDFWSVTGWSIEFVIPGNKKERLTLQLDSNFEGQE